ncbi:radical SAM protein [Clostridium sp.]|uniref:radical SAM protein n=1 Tax=Clostridium sp. TaxID=1506 RepID=UPI0026DCDDD2|nr:radical SAM protein [Clostridium sp.]MDO5039402.1 radical SAM protein [Clostridium sp.]
MLSPKYKAEQLVIKQLLNYLRKNPEKNLGNIVSLVRKFDNKGLYKEQYDVIEGFIKEENNNWVKLMSKIATEVNPHIVETVFTNFLLNAAIRGCEEIDKNIEKYGYSIPFTILVDPTTACNKKCIGCWAADYNNALNLSYDQLDKLFTEGKELGIYFYIMTGGEPLVRKDDILKLAKKHNDCVFMIFTNGTLIDQKFCDDLCKVGNIVPTISVEGFDDATDGRRGKGSWDDIMRAMDLMKSNHVPFGFSTCFTTANCDSVLSDEFIDLMIDKGAYFSWYFTFMPIGCKTDTSLMANPDQREKLYRTIRAWRNTKPIFNMDFWHDAEYVGGCIAGGRRYCHINANGDVEPCVFCHYSSANIKDVSLIEALGQPLFLEYQKNQPFNENQFRPCPILDNAPKIAEMVKNSGAKSTEFIDPEDVDSLCKKTIEYGKTWAKRAEPLWKENIENKKKNK